MFILKFILFAVVFGIILFVFGILRLGFGAWQQMRSMGKAAKGKSNKYTNTNQQREREKVFQKSDGEYVEFEEITDSQTTNTTKTTSAADSINSRSYEGQVSDAEYEEIK